MLTKQSDSILKIRNTIKRQKIHKNLSIALGQKGTREHSKLSETLFKGIASDKINNVMDSNLIKSIQTKRSIAKIDFNNNNNQNNDSQGRFLYLISKKSR